MLSIEVLNLIIFQCCTFKGPGDCNGASQSPWPIQYPLWPSSGIKRNSAEQESY